MATVASMRLEGLQELKKHLRELGSTRARSTVRRATEAASTPVLQTARRLVPVDSRQLLKSLGKKVRTYRSSGNSVAVIGPRVGFKAQVQDRRGRRVLRNPSRYGHLVERPHRVKAGSSVAGRPFLAPALEANRSKVQNIFRRHIEDTLIKAR